MYRRFILALAACLTVISVSCGTALGAGFWELSESAVTSNVAVKAKSVGTIKFEDTKTIGGAAAFECTVSTEGTVGTGGKDEVTTATVSSCKGTKLCEASGASGKAIHLPWSTHLEEIEGTGRDVISSSGAGTPGWTGECLVLGAAIKDECTGELTTGLEDVAEGVKGLFDSKTPKGTCSLGGAGTGVIAGTMLTENPAGKLLAAKNNGEEKCKGGECLGNSISVDKKTVQFIKTMNKMETATFTNKNWFDDWTSSGHSVTPIKNAKSVWSFDDECEKKAVPKKEACQVTITFTPNMEPGRFEAELKMGGAPSTANVLMEGEV